MELIGEVMARNHEINDAIHDGRSLAGINTKSFGKNLPGHKEQMNLRLA